MTIVPRSLLLLAPLAGLLTWLLLHSVGPRGQDYVWAQRDVARVSLGEAALRGDVLEARVGLLPNYDPLVDDMRLLSDYVNQLAGQAMIRPNDAQLMTELKDRARRDEAALEQFKSDNALLQNSLAYFGVLHARLAASGLGGPLDGVIGRLGSAVLELSRHPTPALCAAVEADLDLVASTAASHPGRVPLQDLALLVTHGRLLVQLLPAVDGDLRTLFAVSTDDLRNRIRASQDARRIKEEKRAQRYRLALYVSAVLLLVVLAYVAVQLRTGLQLLRRHAHIEALLAEISTRLLATQADDFEAMMQDTLGQLGVAFEADRVHLLELADPECVLHWVAPGIDDTSLPTAVLFDAVSAATDPDELLEVPLVRHAGNGPLATALRRANIAAWYGTVLRVDDRRQAVLSFDRITEDRNWPRGGTGLLRMASEVVQGALERHRALSQRAELEARLARGRRLEAVGAFASGIAHNFNNLTGAIMGYAEMAADASAGDPQAGHYIGEIRRAGERAQQLVGKILDFGGRRSAPFRPVPVDKLLRDAASMLTVTLPAHVELVVEPPAHGEFVQGDAVQLQQVLMNLVHNGAQAIVDAGTITVRADAVRLAKAQTLSHEAVVAGDYIRIGVADTGSGMDAAVLENIFQPFFTTRPAGTGLGLPTVLEIVRHHQGAVDVRSVPQQGSTFTVWLPKARSDTEMAADPCTRTGRTILLLAPSRSLVLSDEEMLAALGYEPVGFHDVEAALDAARSDPGRFDAVLIDPSRLDKAGHAIVRCIRNVLPKVPLILLTSGPVSESPFELAGLGVSLQTQRPIRSSSIAAALEGCLEAGMRRGSL